MTSARAALCLALSACAGGGAPPAAAVFPQRVAGFERTEDPQTERGGTVAGYEFTEAGPIIATVKLGVAAGGSLLPSLDSGARTDPQAAAAVLERSKAQVRRYYAAARTVSEGPVYQMLSGRLTTGRRARLVFDDVFAGKEQPIALEIVVLCCDAAARAYEYRFRFPANLADEVPIAEFKQAFRPG